jgi:uncharacterized protein YggE
MENEVKGFLKNQNKTVLTWAVSVLLFSLSAAVLMYTFNKQKESNSYSPSKYYTSEGTARMKISPDFAELSLNLVSTSSVSIEEAKVFNQNKINEIKKGLEGKKGVEISKVTDYTTYPESIPLDVTYSGYEGDDYYQTSHKDYSYGENYMFKLNTLTDVDSVESLLKSKVKDNSLSYVSYPVYKLTNAEAKFRELSQESLKVSRANAKNIEKSAGLSLGEPFSVYVGEYYTDSSTGQVPPQIIARDFFSYMDKGEREYELKTSITYEVK